MWTNVWCRDWAERYRIFPHKYKYLCREVLRISICSRFPYLMRFWLILRLRMEWIRIKFWPLFLVLSSCSILNPSHSRLSSFRSFTSFSSDSLSLSNDVSDAVTHPTTSNTATHQHSFKLETNSSPVFDVELAQDMLPIPAKQQDLFSNANIFTPRTFQSPWRCIEFIPWTNEICVNFEYRFLS